MACELACPARRQCGSVLLMMWPVPAFLSWHRLPLAQRTAVHDTTQTRAPTIQSASCSLLMFGVGELFWLRCLTSPAFLTAARVALFWVSGIVLNHSCAASHHSWLHRWGSEEEARQGPQCDDGLPTRQGPCRKGGCTSCAAEKGAPCVLSHGAERAGGIFMLQTVF